MPDWLSYAPRDFLMFGPEVYWRLFELQARALWPAPVVAGAAGLMLIALLALRRQAADRAALLILALAFVGGGHFLATRYAPINWPAGDAAWAFVVAAGLFGVVALAGEPGRSAPRPLAPRLIGLVLLGLAVIVYPLLGSGFGRPLAQAEIFGLAPDPTAIASLGVLSLGVAGRYTVPLALIPAAWCAFSAAILLTLGEGQGWVVAAAVLLWGIGAGVGRMRRGRPPQRH